MKAKSGHKIIIWKSTDTPVARNPWTVGWQVLHYATAEKVQHTLVWKQKKKRVTGICMVMEHVCGRVDHLWGLISLTTFRWKTFWILGNLPAGNHVTKIISCQVNTSSRQGSSNSKGFLLVLFWFYLPMKVAMVTFIVARGNLHPPPIST